MRLSSTWVAVAFLACASPQPEVRTPIPAAVETAGPIIEVTEPAPIEAPAADSIRIPVATERAIDDAVFDAIETRHMPGCVVAIGRADHIAFLRAYGERAVDPEHEPNAPDTIYDLASLTKPIATASAIALLRDRGALDFDDPVVRHLPSFASRTITIRHLLTHTSGLPSDDPLAAYEGETRAQSIARILAIEPVTAPGTRTLYSDLGFIVLGEVVAAAAHEPLETFVNREIFAPLGMDETTFRPPSAWLSRIAPTERAVRRGGEMIRGVVHDPRAFRLDGIAGHAGLFSTARDLSRFSQMMLGEGAFDDQRVLAASTVRELIAPRPLPGGITRALGWDVRSVAEARAHRGMSARAFGHLGWTGTAMWIDPAHDLFFIVLSNDVHPDGRGDVRPLAREIESIAVAGLPGFLPAPEIEVRAGIDVAIESNVLRDRALVLLTHDAARTRDGRRSLDALVRSGHRVLRVLAPEHGLSAEREGAIRDGRDRATNLAVFGLFGATRRPTDAMLEGADTLVIDLVDVGARFYTYASSMREALIAAAARSMRVVILDRPNPLGGAIIEGPSLDPDLHSFVNHHDLPVRHGLTLGELARLLDRELELGFGDRLSVIAVEGWQRREDARAIGARWVAPSPNLPSLDSVELYPAVALLEGADISVGRGTDSPFRIIGAPWLDSARVIALLETWALSGARFTETRFTPRSATHRGRSCRGIAVDLDPDVPRVPIGLALVRAIATVHPGRLDRSRLAPMLGSARALDALLDRERSDVRAIADAQTIAESDARAFTARRAPVLLYR